MATRKSKSKSAPWERKNPARKHKHLGPAKKQAAKRAAKKAGRRYPNLVDNMRAARATKSRGKGKSKTRAKAK